MQLGQTAGPQTALARHQLVAVQAKTAHAHRLEQPVLQDAHGEGGDLVVVKHGAGLIGGWLDPLQRQKNDPADLLFLSHLVLLSRGEQEGRIERAHTVRPCGSKDLVRGTLPDFMSQNTRKPTKRKQKSFAGFFKFSRCYNGFFAIFPPFRG